MKWSWDPASNPRAGWLFGVVAGLLALTVPLLAIEIFASHPPELRVVSDGQRLSALIKDGNDRILVLNNNRTDEVTALFGKVRKPWEPQPSVVIAPANDRSASGVWEALQQIDLSQVVIVGVPGAARIWSEIERYCREHSIKQSYVADVSSFSTDNLQVIILGPTDDMEAGAVVVRRDNINSVISFAESSAESVTGSVQIRSALSRIDINNAISPGSHYINVGTRNSVKIIIESDRLRIRGGHIYSDDGV